MGNWNRQPETEIVIIHHVEVLEQDYKNNFSYRNYNL